MQNMFKRYPELQQLCRRFLAMAPSSLRLGKKFWEWYSFFDVSENWSIEKMQEYQLNRIKDLLPELISTSKFYQRHFKELNVSRIQSLSDFHYNVPTLSRTEFCNNFNDILCSDWRARKLEKSQTSGTTGLALQFYHSFEDKSREWAAICHQWKRVGFLPTNSRRAEFRGLTAQNKLLEQFPHNNMIRCSILNLKKEHIRYYAEQIKKNGIKFYHGYPSALYLLSKEIIDNKINFPQPKALLLASEAVYDWQLDKIEKAFPDSKLYAHYGCAERTILSGWCEYRREYHVLPQYSFVEVDKKTSEIIGTNLFNSINGFVRYRMTDSALETCKTTCPDCKRPYTPRLVKLGGRIEDFLFSPEKGWIPPAIVTYPLKSLRAIREVQFIQKEKTEIRILYTKNLNNDLLVKKDLDAIGYGLHDLFGNSMKLKFYPVDDFKRGSTGKFKWIVCQLEESPSIINSEEM